MAAAIVVHMAWKKEQQEGLEMKVIFFFYFSDQKFNLWLHEKKSKLLIL